MLKSEIEHASRVGAFNFFPEIDERGPLLSIGFRDDALPFTPVRSFVITEMQVGVSSAEHASIHCDEVLVLVSGEIEIEIVDGQTLRTFLLNRCGAAVVVPRLR